MIISKTENGQYLIQINSSLTAFQQEVNFVNGEGAYKTPEDFQNLVINHFRNSVTIVINQKDTLQFVNPHVFLGHETKLVAEIIGLAKTVHEIHVRNEIFKDVHNNQSTVIFLLDGFPDEKYTLNRDNQHQINLALEDGNWIKIKAKGDAFFNQQLPYLILLPLIGIMYYFHKRRRKQKPN